MESEIKIRECIHSISPTDENLIALGKLYRAKMKLYGIHTELRYKFRKLKQSKINDTINGGTNQKSSAKK
jgi:hypothetical protein